MMSSYFHIYALGKCPYCIEAIGVLNASGANYVLTMLDRCASHLDHLKEKHQYMTVPMIFEHNAETHEVDRFIGGCSDLKELFSEKGEEKQESASCELP